jgi:hypothetical protein
MRDILKQMTVSDVAEGITFFGSIGVLVISIFILA